MELFIDCPVKFKIANNCFTTLQILCYMQMTVTTFRGWIVVLLLDVAIQQHDACLSVALSAAHASNALQSSRRIQRAAIREMLIPLIQSKWDAGPNTVLGPCQPAATHLRNAKGRANNMKQ